MARRRFHWSTVFDCVMHETDENGDTLVQYTHEPGQFGPLLSEIRDGAESYHHYDALGSTTMLSNDAGTVTDTFTFDAWGNQIARTGTTETPYTWCGRWGYQDDSATTGGHYVRARSYQPAVARWVASDYIEYEGPNRYRYGSNRATSLFDPSGLVVFTLIPESPDDAPWSKRVFDDPKDPNKVGDTVTDVYTDLRCTKTKNGKFKITYCLFGRATIFLDPDKIPGVAVALKKKTLTLVTAYGHEQRHVQNFIELLKRAKGELADFEKEEYNSADEAKAAGKKHLEDVAMRLEQKLQADRDHKGTDPKSPKAGSVMKKLGKNKFNDTPEEPPDTSNDEDNVCG